MPYRFAIIGCGNIAGRHADQIRNTGELAAVCDTDLKKVTDFASAYQTLPYTDLAAMLAIEKPDVVAVCSPNGLHALHSITALQAGAHVLCEKPMALFTEDAEKMIDAAAKAGKRLFVVKQNRYNPPVLAAKKLLDEGKIGRISSFQINCFWNRNDNYYNNPWRGTLEMDGGILFTQFSHFIDLLYWFLGEIEEVTGSRENFMHKNSIAFEDTGIAAIRLKSGPIGTLHYTINAHQCNMEGSFTLFGEKGTLKIGGQYLNQIDYFSVGNEAIPLLEKGNAANNYGSYEGSMGNHATVYRELIKAIDDPLHAFVEAEEALKSVEMIRRIYDRSPFVQSKQQQ